MDNLTNLSVKPLSSNISFGPNGFRHHVFNAFYALILMITFFLSGCQPKQTTERDVALHLTRGQAYQNQGQYRAAMIEAKNAMHKAPDHPGGAMLLASIYIDLGQSRTAIDVLNTIADKNAANKNTGDYRYTLARAYLLRKKYKSALKVLAPLSHQPETYTDDVKLVVARAYQGLKAFTKALQIYQHLLKADESNPDALLGMVHLEIARGNPEQAEVWLKPLLDTQPQPVDALIIKAGLNIKKQLFDDAEALLSHALARLPNTDLVTPQKANVLRMLMDVLTLQGRSAEALVYSRLLSESLPGVQEIDERFKAALKAYTEGDLPLAEAKFTEILSLAPSHELSGTLLGIINYLQGDISKADQYFDEYLDAEIASPTAKQAFALTQLKLNQPEKVTQLLEKEAQKTRSADLLALYGVAALHSIDIEKGIRALRKATALSPKKSRLHLILARHFNRLSPPDHTTALTEIKAAFEKQPEDVYVQAALAQQWLMMGKEDKAHKHIETVIEQFGLQAGSQSVAGAFYLNTDEPAKAKEHFRKAIKLNATDSGAYQGMAQAAVKLADWDNAIESYQRILDMNSENINAYRGLLNVYQQQGKIEKGLTHLKSLSKSTRSNASLAVLTEYYTRQGDITTAWQFYKRIKTTEEDQSYLPRLAAQLYFEEARQMIQANDYTKARQILIKVLKLVPNNISALALLTQSEIKSEQFIEAEKLIGQIYKMGRYPLKVSILRSDLELARGNSGRALRILQKTWDQYPDNEIGRRFYSTLLKQKGKTAALEFLNKWASALPGSLDVKVYRANFLQAEGKLEQAVILYEEVLEKQPDLPMALNNLAWTYSQLGDERALETAKRAYNQAPAVPDILDTYGWLLIQNNHTKEGIALLKQALEKAPDDKTILDHLQKALSKQRAAILE